jgi:hypothetical protein
MTERKGKRNERASSRRPHPVEARKQEVARGFQGSSTQVLHEEDKGDFAYSPLDFGFVWKF